MVVAQLIGVVPGQFVAIVAFTHLSARDSNFGMLLPWWDMLFGTANFELRFEASGVRDQVEPGLDGSVRDYGQGFWAQQWRGLLRLAGRV